MNGLTKRNVIAGVELRLQVVEGDIQILRGVQSGKKLSLTFETGNRISRSCARRNKIVEPPRKPGVAIDPVFQAIADILATIPNVFPTITNIFPPVTDATVSLRVPDIFAPIKNILPAITDVLAPITNILSLVARQWRPGRRPIVGCLPLAYLA